MGGLRTVTRVTLVVGAGLVLAPLLILMDGGAGPELPILDVAMRAQIGLGILVVTIGFALWQRKPWAHKASLFLLRAGTCAAVGWSIYGAFEISRMTAVSGVLVVMLFVITAFWFITFKRGIAYLSRPSVLAELEGRVQ